MVENQENIYWLFSSSAQTISAFVAFLITGFTLVISLLDGLQQKDETLEEIHDRLKSNYYKRIRILAITTGVAIIMSLWMVYLNAGNWSWKPSLFILTAIINSISILIGILFVVSIINPSKYKRTARELIKEDKKEFSLTGNQVDQLSFMTAFISLEKQVRDYLINRQLYVPYGDTPKMLYSFRQMVTALYQNEIIDRKTLNDLMQINKYRNLVFHGHEDKVDKGMLDRVKTMQTVIEKLV